MKKNKFYFESIDSEVCYTAAHHLHFLAPGKEIEVYEAIKYKPSDKIKGVFWCGVNTFCGDDSSETCGKQCKQYEPRNGVSGCCKHHTTVLYYAGDKVTLKKE